MQYISLSQICYCGNAVTDLSYLIYTTSTTMFRHEHLDDLLHLYFEDLIDVVRELGLSEKQYHPGFDEFRNEFFKVRRFWMQYHGYLKFKKFRYYHIYIDISIFRV